MTSPSIGRLRLATRGSPLAVLQAESVAKQLAKAHGGLTVELVIVETAGDKNRTDPLRVLGGQGIFAKEIQRAVLEGDADVAVHSAKDLPSVTPEGLELVAIPERLDAADVLVGKSLEGLGPGATVATGSPRRAALLQSLRPDLSIVELRGNMATRLSMPGTNGIDAIVTARAALIRLQSESLIGERLDPMVFTPQVAQGALALECRYGDAAGELVRVLDLPDAHRCIAAERAFLSAMGAGCTIPAGAWCVDVGGTLTIRAVMFNEVEHLLERHELQGKDPVSLGTSVAQAFSLSERF